METRKLRAGESSLDVTVLGFGGAPLGNLYTAITDSDAEATLNAAWNAGIRVFDTAPYYGLGLSEERFGKVLPAYPRELLRPLHQDRPCSPRLPASRSPADGLRRHAGPHL